MEVLKEQGLIKAAKNVDGIKILANGTLDRKLTVEAYGFSAKAKEAIEAAGGTAQEV